MTQFTSETRRLLADSGWHEERRFDTAAYQQAVLAAGHPVSDPVCAFLERYGDLEIETIIGDTGLNTLMSQIVQKHFLSPFSEEAGRTLYVIGSCSFEMMTLCMDSSGRVYRNMDRSSHNFGGIDLFLIADSGEEALGKLITEDQTEATLRGEWIAHLD